MTIKISALVMCVSAAILCLISWIIPKDPYFVLVSSSHAANVTRLVLSAILLSLSAKKRFKFRISRKLLLQASIILVGFGGAGLLASPLDYALYGQIDPFDFAFCVMSGLLISARALELKPGRRLVHLPHLPKFTASRPLTRLLQPKSSL